MKKGISGLKKKNRSFAFARGRYLLYIKLFRTEADRHNSILMSLLLLLTIKSKKSAYQFEGLLPPTSFKSPPFRNSPPIQMQVTIPD